MTFVLPDSCPPVSYSVSPENSVYLPPIPTPPGLKPGIEGAQLVGSAWLQVQVDTEQSQEHTRLPCSRSHVEASSAVKALGKSAAFVEIWHLGILFFSSTGSCFRVWGPQLGFPYLRDTLTNLRAPALLVPMTTLASPERAAHRLCQQGGPPTNGITSGEKPILLAALLSLHKRVCS